MNDFSSRKYTSDEVSRIIRRALKSKNDDITTHSDLLELAKELGLDSATVETAVEEEQYEFEKERAQRIRIDRRKAGFKNHLWSYIIVIGALMLLNIFAGGSWWFQWPALGCGIGLAFSFRAAYFATEGELRKK
jgi:post-segregation antitoxin (ccd killing protein)